MFLIGKCAIGLNTQYCFYNQINTNTTNPKICQATSMNASKKVVTFQLTLTIFLVAFCNC